jgi:hypothetical protein
MAKKFLAQIDMQVAPTEPSHVARLQDVEDIVAGRVKSPVLAATTANLAATYNEKTLTASGNGALAVDGVTVAAGDRILVKNQTDRTQNGVYAVTDAGDTDRPFVLARATDFDASSELISGVRIAVASGVSNRGVWYLSSPAPLTLDSSNLEFVRDTATSEAKKAVYTITGDDTTVQFDFSHSWGTKDVMAALYDVSTDEAVVADFRCTSVNDVRVTFATAPATGENYRLVLMTVVNTI